MEDTEGVRKKKPQYVSRIAAPRQHVRNFGYYDGIDQKKGQNNFAAKNDLFSLVVAVVLNGLFCYFNSREKTAHKPTSNG
jgi:hypothetical protein